MISEHSYFDGAVKSLGFTEGGVDYSFGVIQPGDDREFDTTRNEQIQVVFGDLVDLRDGNSHLSSSTLKSAIAVLENEPKTPESENFGQYMVNNLNLANQKTYLNNPNNTEFPFK